MRPSDTNLFGEELPRVGHPLFRESWSNRKAFWVGVYSGKGMTATSICRRLGDGATPNMITAMTSNWGYHSNTSAHTYASVRVDLPGIDRTRLDEAAMQRGGDLETLCQQILERVSRDNLVSAILDL